MTHGTFHDANDSVIHFSEHINLGQKIVVEGGWTAQCRGETAIKTEKWNDDALSVS